MAFEPEWLLPPKGPPKTILVDPEHVYWDILFALGAIGRATIGGGAIEEEWIKSPKVMSGNFVLLTHEEHIYWVVKVGERWFLARAKLDGTEIESEWFELGDRDPRGMATDGTYFYIGLGSKIEGETISPARLGRLNLETLAWEPSWFTYLNTYKGGGFLEPGPGRGVAVDSEYVYWSVPEGVARAKKDLSVVNENWYSNKALKRIASLAIDSNYLWLGTNEGTIVRARLDGKGLEKLPLLETSKTGPATVYATVDSEYLYWTSLGKFIGRWKLDEVTAEEVPAAKEGKEIIEEEEAGGGKTKEEEEKEKSEKEAEEGKEKAEEEKEREEREKKEEEEKEEREEGVTKEEKEREEEGSGTIVEEPIVEPAGSGAPVHPGVVRFGRITR